MKRDNTTTRRLFERSGISEGMRILELGCGPGEVTEVLSRIVGPAGSVLGIDRSEEMISSARERLDAARAENVRLIRADLNGVPDDYLSEFDRSSFDGVAGRRVLMYLPHPERVVADLLPWLRRGGLAVFEEMDTTIYPAQSTAMRGRARAAAWLDSMLEAEGANRSMGSDLPVTLRNAGLRFERVWGEAVIDGQGDQYSLAELLLLLAPRLQSAGVATASEVEALVARIEAECDTPSIFVSGMRFCAQARRL